MTTKHYFIGLTFLLISSISFAQNYTKGYIINLQGDTLFGQVDYKRWDKSPQKVAFKIDKKSDTYNVHQVQEFGVLNATF